MGGRESAMPAKGLQVRLMSSLSLWARLKIRGVYFRCQGSASKDDGISGDRRCRRDLPAFAGCAEPDWASYTYVVGRCSGAGAEIETCKDPAKRETGGPFQNTHHQKRQTHIFFTSDACFLNSAVHETPPPDALHLLPAHSLSDNVPSTLLSLESLDMAICLLAKYAACGLVCASPHLPQPRKDIADRNGLLRRRRSRRGHGVLRVEHRISAASAYRSLQVE